MPEERQITFMQARISQMATRRWGMPLRQVAEMFRMHGVLDYIADCFGYFHLEGDGAVLEDVEEFLRMRGVALDASPK